jgi:hypothetical protein
MPRDRRTKEQKQADDDFAEWKYEIMRDYKGASKEEKAGIRDQIAQKKRARYGFNPFKFD